MALLDMESCNSDRLPFDMVADYITGLPLEKLFLAFTTLLSHAVCPNHHFADVN